MNTRRETDQNQSRVWSRINHQGKQEEKQQEKGLDFLFFCGEKIYLNQP